MKNLITLKNESDFDKIIQNNEFVVVDFYADWCGPCRNMQPILEEFCKKHSHATVLKVNIEDFVNIAQKFSIKSIPTFLIYKNNKLINTNVGRLTLEQLENDL